MKAIEDIKNTRFSWPDLVLQEGMTSLIHYKLYKQHYSQNTRKQHVEKPWKAQTEELINIMNFT